MKIYINQDGQAVGPFSKEQLLERIYSGQLARSVFACVDGSQDWVPLESLLNTASPVAAPANPPAAPPAAGALKHLFDPKEKTALVWLYIASVPVWLILIALIVAGRGVPLITVGFIAMIIAFGEMWFMAYLKTNAVRVSETQLPELHRAARQGSERLGLPCPDVYVLQHNVWNAFAAKFFGRRVIVLLSGAVDSILLKGDMQQLAWVVGHELGHHWAGHLDWRQKLARPGGWLVWLALWHSRRRELTCDRVGLYCAGSLRASQLALTNLTVGAQLADKVNPAAAVAQWQQHRGEFFVRYRTLYSSYPHLLARLDHLNQAGQEFGMSR